MGLFDCWNQHSVDTHRSVDVIVSKTTHPRSYSRFIERIGQNLVIVLFDKKNGSNQYVNTNVGNIRIDDRINKKTFIWKNYDFK
jgi:hypothetical protein